MVVWILKLKTYDQYDYTQTFATKEEAKRTSIVLTATITFQ